MLWCISYLQHNIKFLCWISCHALVFRCCVPFQQVQYPTGITTGYNTFRHNHDKEKRPRDQMTYYDKKTVSKVCVCVCVCVCVHAP